jgi:hypothetical protein
LGGMGWDGVGWGEVGGSGDLRNEDHKGRMVNWTWRTERARWRGSQKARACGDRRQKHKRGHSQTQKHEKAGQS